jgi:hypothetical protein
MIFKFSYVAARQRFSTSGHNYITACYNSSCLAEKKCFCYQALGDNFDWDMRKDSPPTAQFPNSLALVCSHWGNVMLLSPTFWTRVIIILNSSTFPPLDLSLQLDSAGGAPIDIIVTRVSESDTLDLGVEQSRMAYIVSALRPHFQQCRKLHFDVVHSSSLPQVLGILPCIMPHLQELSLDSCIDSGCPAVLPYDQPNKASKVNWPQLKTVIIDGWNFVDLYHHAPGPNEWIFSACKTLAIKFGGDGFPFNSVVELLDKIPIDSFTVDSVSFSEREATEDLDSFEIGTMALKNLSAKLTDTILSSYTYVESLEITNCYASNIDQMPVTYALTLRDIGVDQSIERVIQMWNGWELYVNNCPGFNDTALQMMGKIVIEDGDDRKWDVQIHQCNYFSVKALKKLVKIRNKEPQKGPRLRSICVNATFPLPEEDLYWFSKRVGYFEWVNMTRE